MEQQNRKIAVLGSTGSVGTQALDVAEKIGADVELLTGGANVRLLEEQARRFHPKWCAAGTEDAARDLRARLADTNIRVLGGTDGICESLSEIESETVLNAISGSAALLPSLEVLRRGKRLATANKESIVIAGDLIRAAADASGAQIIPVDSEHSAIFQSLKGGRKEEVSRLILTASGGPFFGKSRSELGDLTVDEALAHPTWKMGAKITVDSATLMNKGFEIIEAVRLFGIPEDRVDVVVHRESIIHSMVEYIDSAVIAQLGAPDMRLCIQYALTYPERAPSCAAPLDFAKLGKMTFFEPDTEAFPLLETAREAIRRDGIVPAVLNAADETAVELFLRGAIRLTDVFDLVSDAVATAPDLDAPTLETILAYDEETRTTVREKVAARAGR